MVYLNIGKIIRKGKPRVIGGRKVVGQLANGLWRMAYGILKFAIRYTLYAMRYALFVIRYTLIDSRAAEDLEIGINPGLTLLNVPTYRRDNFATGEII